MSLLRVADGLKKVDWCGFLVLAIASFLFIG
jgi:hypothetical protein